MTRQFFVAQCCFKLFYRERVTLFISQDANSPLVLYKVVKEGLESIVCLLRGLTTRPVAVYRTRSVLCMLHFP